MLVKYSIVISENTVKRHVHAVNINMCGTLTTEAIYLLLHNRVCNKILSPEMSHYWCATAND